MKLLDVHHGLVADPAGERKRRAEQVAGLVEQILRALDLPPDHSFRLDIDAEGQATYGFWRKMPV